MFKTIAGYTPLGLYIKGIAAAFTWASDHGLLPFRSALDAIWSAIQRVADAIRDLIGWIKNIHWPSPPKFLSKIPGSPFAASYGLPAAASRFAYASGAGGASARSSSSGGGVTFVIQGAIDPEGTARQIRRLLAAHDRRQGRAP